MLVDDIDDAGGECISDVRNVITIIIFLLLSLIICRKSCFVVTIDIIYSLFEEEQITEIFHHTTV